jgi:hypothetical protein
MYELLSQYAHKGKWEVDIDLLKDYLGLDSGQYKNFTQFQDRILDYSKKEILKNCGLSFSWSITGKDRKKVTKITFDIYQIEQVKKKEINGDVILSMQYLNKLSPSETSLNIKALLKGYTLLQWQIDYLVENKEMHEDIVRVVATIEQMSTSENPIVNKTIQEETLLGLKDPEIWKDTFLEINKKVNKFYNKLQKLFDEKTEVYGYAANAKSITLLNYAKINPNWIVAIADDAIAKQNKFLPGLNIPIKSREDILKENHDEIIIFSWNLYDEVFAKLRAAGYNGNIWKWDDK